MIIAKIQAEERYELGFDIDIQGSKSDPTDIRFIIEGQVSPETGETVQDTFSLLCRAERTNNAIKVYIPKLLNLFKAGTYRAKLEVVLEDRLFTPLIEEIEIEYPTTISVVTEQHKQDIKESVPTAKLVSIIGEIAKQTTIKTDSKIESKTEPTTQTQINEIIEQKSESKTTKKTNTIIDDSWKTMGFNSMKNPFRKT